MSERTDWHDRINQVEREFLVTRQALDVLRTDVSAGRLGLAHTLEWADLTAAVESLEGTYTVRLTTVFEAGLMSFWRSRRPTEPRLVDLINGIASTCRIVSSDDIEAAHHVREWRNKLVHETVAAVAPLSLRGVRNRVNRFLKWLPPRW